MTTRTRRLLMAALCAAAGGVVSAQSRFVDLDRIHFEHVTRIQSPSLHADAVRSALPQRLPGAIGVGEAPGSANRADDSVFVEDFSIPGLEGRQTVVLRQVVDASHRIHGVWWALYAGGRRGDTWYFEASPERTENKALANPSVVRVRRAPDGALEIDLMCTMSRPQGAEWQSAWTLRFDVSRDGLRYRHAEERCGMTRGYDTGDKPPATTYWVARRRGRMVEVTAADDVPESTVEACESQVQTQGARDEPDAVLARLAACVTSSAKVRVYARSIETPAFIERGWKPSQ